MILTETSQLHYKPQRIVSLVPSQTELLFDLGLETEAVGITKFCVHPGDWFRSKKRVGGTKTVDMEAVRKLNPDLIIANKEENVQEQVEALAEEFPVWVTDVNNLEDALQMIRDIGALTGKNEEASHMVSAITGSFNNLHSLTHNKRNPLPETQKHQTRTAYLIWRNPYMAAGGDTFINDMLSKCGLINIFVGESRYPEVSISQLSSHNCQLLLLSSEPYPFAQKHIDELAGQLPGTKIMLVDGEMFSWYGSRLLKAPAYFEEIINTKFLSA